MELGEPIMKILRKDYEPLTMVEQTFKRYDLAFRTDENGKPVLLFIGKKDANGNIRGDRFARRLKYGHNGELIKDHWEHKGKAT